MNKIYTHQLHKHSVRQSKFPINILAEAIKQLTEMPIPKTAYYHVASIDTWQIMRDSANLCFAQWSDEQLSNYNKESGYIGNMCGMECYILAPIPDILSFNPNKISLISLGTSIK